MSWRDILTASTAATSVALGITGDPIVLVIGAGFVVALGVLKLLVDGDYVVK